jgi:diguanylate cyclase (GGDEF)-like protein
VAAAVNQRTIFAREAAQAGEPVTFDLKGGRALRALKTAPLAGASTVFVPLLGRERCQAVLEIDADPATWEDGVWEVLPSVARQAGIAFDRSRTYEEMQTRADRDFVTGVYNHRFMHTYLERVVEAARSRGRCAAVAFLDIDNFKAFNDSLGHSAGDRVLQTVAHQLRLMTDRVGIVGRSGGDEFMVVLPYHTAAETQTLVEAFQDWLSISAPPVSGLFRIQVSCGYAVFPDDGDKAPELLAAADARLYRAKAQGGRSAGAGGSGNGRGERTLGVYGLLGKLIESIQEKDNYTRVHCEKTSEYAAAFAQKLGLSPSAQRSLRLAALLHDVGKVGVPEHILCKPGPLSSDERQVVQHQLTIATQLIVDVPNADEVRAVVRHHRERWDGAGYPSGLAGDAIPYLSRVLAVADAYAAITLDRPYRAALMATDAFDELRRVAGSQLDPELVAKFAGVIARERSAGSLEKAPPAA